LYLITRQVIEECITGQIRLKKVFAVNNYFISDLVFTAQKWYLLIFGKNLPTLSEIQAFQ